MAKSKNHTNHNQTKKNHANGIKKPNKFARGVDKGKYLPTLRNSRYAKKVIFFFILN
jgi:hypothetical protein